MYPVRKSGKFSWETNRELRRVTTYVKVTADFDGDALGGMLILDEKTLVSADRLAAHTGVLDLQKARTISGKIALPGPTVATYANWVHEVPDNEDAELFKQLLVDS